MKIIPAIDLLDGKVVRLQKGDYNSKKVYADDPAEFISQFVDAGFKHIHIIDLSGSKDEKITTLDTLKNIKQKFGISVQFGGGIRTAEDVRLISEAGVTKPILGSVIYREDGEFEKILENSDPENLIAASDVLNGNIMIRGWLDSTGVSLEEHIERCQAEGIREFLITDISKDGLLAGPNIQLYKYLKEKFRNIKIIASGGVSEMEDIILLEQYGIDSAVVGKAFYEGKIKLKEMKRYAG